MKKTDRNAVAEPDSITTSRRQGTALSTRINAVRSAIGDSGVEQRPIETLPGKSVRFVGSVREPREPVTTTIAVSSPEPIPASADLPNC